MPEVGIFVGVVMVKVSATTDDDVRDEEETSIDVEITVEVGVGINDEVEASVVVCILVEVATCAFNEVEASEISVEVAAFSVEIFEISWLAVSFSSGS